MVSVVKALTGFAQRHPAVAKGIALVAAGFGVLMVAAGGVMIALGGLIGQFALLRFAIGHAGLGLFGGRARASGAASAIPGMAGRGAVSSAGGMLSGMGAAISAISLPVLLLGAALAAVAFLIWKF